MSLWTEKTVKDLRRFGLSFGCAFGLLGGLLWWRDRPAAPWVLGVAGTVLALGIAFPRALAPLEWVLAKIFKAVTTALTYVLVTITFYLVITPMGLLMRLFGRDPLGLKFDRGKASYWVDVEPDGPWSRPDKPF
jgi:hypothetical protein